jgi:tetratricopeptide (TPR) repeat protein
LSNSSTKFIEAVKLFNDCFYWDAIEAFQDALSDGLEDMYVDDCFLNIGISYMQLNLYLEAEEYFNKSIEAAKTLGDHIDSEGSIVGKTSDRAKLGLIRVSLAKNQLDEAKNLLEEIRDSESYIKSDGKDISIYEIASNEINLAESNDLKH